LHSSKEHFHKSRTDNDETEQSRSLNVRASGRIDNNTLSVWIPRSSQGHGRSPL